MSHTLISHIILSILVLSCIIDSFLLRRKLERLEDLNCEHIQAIGCLFKIVSGECKMEKITIEVGADKPKAVKAEEKVCKCAETKQEEKKPAKTCKKAATKKKGAK